MTRYLQFLLTALRHLRRGSDRTLTALACIAFGVMSLTALNLVARATAAALVREPSHLLGADLTLSPRGAGTLRPEHLAQLDAWEQVGLLDEYLPIAEAGTVLLRRPNSGEVHLAAGLGIDPARYPLAGAFVLAGTPAAPAELLAAPGSLILTLDLARRHGLAVGDAVIISDLRVGAALPAVVRGLASDTPNHQGGKVYYSYATAELLAGGQPAFTLAAALAPDPEAAASAAAAAGWFALPAERLAALSREGHGLMDLLFKGAGLLGLMVGGIGIATTMQVRLRRRQREVAIWKVLGYTAGDLALLFALEALLLGALGSVLGASLGLAISGLLLELVALTGNTLVSAWAFSPAVVLLGLCAGLATTVLFALGSIITTARVPPMALLRQEALAAARLSWPQAIGLALALAVPFAALTSFVLGSVLKGIGLLLFALAGLVVLGGGLGTLAWAAARWLRVPGLPLLRLAQSSLQRRGLSFVFAMIALFTGIVALALGVAFTRNAQRELGARASVVGQHAVAILAPAAQAPAVRQALAQAGQADHFWRYDLTVAMHAGDLPLGELLIGLDTPSDDLDLSGAPWGSAPEGVYVHALSGVRPGETITLALAGGPRTLTVVGTYTVDYQASLRPALGVLLPSTLALALAPPDTVLVYLNAPAADAARLSAELGRALPNATVVNLLAYRSRFVQAYHNLFVLAVVMSSLALLAGVLLVANALSLTLLERRYEIGVLKAVGYTRAHVLATLVAEYGLLAVLATGAALGGVQLCLLLLGVVNGVAARLLVLDPLSVLVISLLGVGLVLLTVLSAAWAPTRLSPAVTLNDRG